MIGSLAVELPWLDLELCSSNIFFLFFFFNSEAKIKWLFAVICLFLLSEEASPRSVRHGSGAQTDMTIG